ncbi:unnamed protein product [Bubo scandiacus]
MLWGLLLSPWAVQDVAAIAHGEAFRGWKSEGELNRCARRTAGRKTDFSLIYLSQRGCARSAVSTQTPSDRHAQKGNCERTVKSV